MFLIIEVVSFILSAIGPFILAYPLYVIFVKLAYVIATITPLELSNSVLFAMRILAFKLRAVRP